MPEPDFRYRWAKLDEGGFAVFVGYEWGPFAGWWRLVAEFQLEIRASDYADYENHMLLLAADNDPFRRDDDTPPNEMPEIPQSGISLPDSEDEPARQSKASDQPTRGRHPKALEGKRFGSLVAVRLSERITQGRHKHWICRCDCGAETEVRVDHLTGGATKSCSCERKAEPSPINPARAAEMDAMAKFEAERGITKLPAVGDPAIGRLEDLTWDKDKRKWARPIAEKVSG